MVVPCYNEEKRIDLNYWETIIESAKNVYWVFVNDGSEDGTLYKLALLKKDNVEIVNLETNQGKSQAISFGFSALISKDLEFNSMGYVDSDSAFDAHEVLNILSLSDHIFASSPNLAVIFTARIALAGRNIQRNPLRHYLGRAIATYVTWGWRGAPYDTQSGFKIYRCSEIFPKHATDLFATRWFFDLELISRFGSLQEVEILVIPLNSWLEVHGTSLKVQSYFSVLRDIVAIKSIVKRNLNSC